MDSAVALSWALSKNHQVSCLNFNYGSKHNDREYKSAVRICEHYGLTLERVALDFVATKFKSDLLKTGNEIPEGHYEDPSMKRTVVPFRNGIMLSIAAGYAESLEYDQVVIGNHFGDHAIYPDCREKFIKAMEKAITFGTYKEIGLLSPFAVITKAEIARIGKSLLTPFQLTYSCYNGREKHCGKCGTCYERIEAFKLGNVEDPTEYE